MGFIPKGVGQIATSPNLAMGSQLATGIFGSIAGMIPQGGSSGKSINPYETNMPAFQAAWEMQNEAVGQEAGALQKQADIALQEAGREAQIKARDVKEFREMQALKYSGQGVLLEGSPMIVLEETRKRGQQEINAILRRGAAQADLLRRQALMVQTKGRASLLGEQAGFGFEKAKYEAAMKQVQTGAFDPAGVVNILQALSGAGAMFNKPGTAKAPGLYFNRLTNPGIPGYSTMFPGMNKP